MQTPTTAHPSGKETYLKARAAKVATPNILFRFVVGDPFHPGQPVLFTCKVRGGQNLAASYLLARLVVVFWIP
jgi:hypothetical protein